MGLEAAKSRPATDAERTEMRRLLAEGMDAGLGGFSIQRLGKDSTQADFDAGLYKIKNNDLQGMTYPITMTTGQPVQRQLCYGVVVIKDKKYVKYPGKSLYCDATGSSAVATNSQGVSAPAQTPPSASVRSA